MSSAPTMPVRRGRWSRAGSPRRCNGWAKPGRASRRGLRCRAATDSCLLPVTKNFFELPGISTPLDYKAHIEPIVADMVALLATASLVRKVGAPDEEPAESAGP